MVKHSSHTRRTPVHKGFTLIEILAVVAIIGILATISMSVIATARRSANQAVTKSMYSQWATAIAQYKTTYGYYPNLGSGYTANEDTYYNLDNGDICENFVRALSGRNMDGTDLSDTERKSLNRKGETFCDFPKDYYLDGDPKKKKLSDYTGNTKIRVVLDTDRQAGIILKELPENKGNLGLQDGNRLNAKIVIYTLKADGTDCDDIFFSK
ncbi:MAG: type II secretion system GspH family protein [Puniceicoccales bacterium]|jgi:prepilin-type N-terminal cleavage/methylation domain-containing protein|nr:type II secretion system GspH family protein [Puniceicoccales bacterium]